MSGSGLLGGKKISLNIGNDSNSLTSLMTGGANIPNAAQNSSLQAMFGSSAQTFLKAIVLECITDVSLFDNKKLEEYFNIFAPEQFERLASIQESISTNYHLVAPRNSLIIVPINNIPTNENAEKGIYNNIIVAYPFFSSHIMIPCKPGEVVWFFADNADNTEEYYWLSRVHGREYTEDANYTHYYRKYFANYSSKESSNFLDFPNGPEHYSTQQTTGSDVEGTVMIPLVDGQNPFDKIFKDSVNSKSFSPEPVPRITPRIGDTIIQGSNNNSIILTTNRSYDFVKKAVSESSNSVDRSSNSQVDSNNGAVDIVVGRGRFANKNLNSLIKEDKYTPNKNSTEPRVYKNSRNFFETEKNLAFKTKDSNLFNSKISANEGDPHLLEDAARILVSSKLDIDASLGLTSNLPKSVAVDDQNNKPVEINPATDNSVVLLRSDEVRIVARKDESRGIQGSIRIVKEGSRSGDHSVDQGIITIQPDGTIIIDGPKIVIGSGKESQNGSGSQISFGYNAQEPLVLGNTLANLLQEFMQKTIDALTTHTHPTGTGPSGPALPNINAYTGHIGPSSSSTMKGLIGRLNEIKSKIGKTK